MLRRSGVSGSSLRQRIFPASGKGVDRMNVADVVRFQGNPYAFAWKAPQEDFGTWTQLEVSRYQEAVLCREGQSLDLFPCGTHTLTTGNIPLLNETLQFPFGERHIFHAQVWFVNKAYSLEVKWGTASPMAVTFPGRGKANLFRAFGTFQIQIADSRLFLDRLADRLPSYDREGMIGYFRPLFLQQMDTLVAAYLMENPAGPASFPSQRDRLAAFMSDRFRETLAGHGMQLCRFGIDSLTSAEEEISAPSARKRCPRCRGVMEQKQRFCGYCGMDTDSTLPAWEGETPCPHCGTPNGAGAKYCNGCGAAFQRECPHCGAALAGIRAKFCPECGESLQRFCPSCEAPLAGNPHYCPECGHPL